jgi:pilus assembly protein CpaC
VIRSVIRKLEKRKQEALKFWLFSFLFLFLFSGLTIHSLSASVVPVLLRVPVNQSKVITTRALKRVSITNSSIADFVIASPTEVIVNGKELGRTSLHLWDSKGRVDVSLVVLSGVKDIPLMVKADIKSIISQSSVEVSIVEREGSETIVLRGVVQNRLQADIVEELAKNYTHGEVINLVEVELIDSLDNLEDHIRSLIREPEVRVTVVKKGTELNKSGQQMPVSTIILEGFVDDQYDKKRILAICEAFVTNPDQISDLIDVVNPVEVLVEGAVLELATDYSESLGVEWGTSENTTYDGGILTMGTRAVNSASFLENLFTSPHGDVSYLGPRVKTGHNWPWSVDSLNRVDPLYSKINFSLSKNKARVLARPKVVARVGTEASLRVGGEIPLIGETRNGGAEVEYKSFGLEMKITPEVDHKGNITSDFDLRWSTIDFASAQIRNNATYYGMRERSSSTKVTVRDGQHIIISGLTTEDEAKVSSGIPFLSKIPIIGKLFENNDYIEKKSELIIILTPSLYSSKKLQEKYKSFEESENGRSGNSREESMEGVLSKSLGKNQLVALNVAMTKVNDTFSRIMRKDDITITPVNIDSVPVDSSAPAASSLCNKIASGAYSDTGPLLSRIASVPLKNKWTGTEALLESEQADVRSFVGKKIDFLMSQIETSLTGAF